jgi:hypothetical protein
MINMPPMHHREACRGTGPGGEGFMSALRFTCPEQHREFESGIEIDPRTFRKCRDHRIEVHCPFCDAAHEFQVAEGRIDELRVA